VLEHIDDISAAFAVEGGEVKAIATG